MQNQQSPQKNGYGSEIATTQVDIAAAHLSHDLSGVNRSPLPQQPSQLSNVAAQNWHGLPLPKQTPAASRNSGAGATAASLQMAQNRLMTQNVSTPGVVYNAPSSSLPLLASLAAQMPRSGPISPQSSSGDVESNSSFADPELPKDAQPKAKRAQVKNACIHCQKACKKCSQDRPCQRCEKYGYSDCIDSPRKPRQRGIKRGPYKRKGDYGSLPKGNAWQSLQLHGSMLTNSQWRDGPQVPMSLQANAYPVNDPYQTPFSAFSSRQPMQMHMAQQWMNRDLQLQAHIAALPLATPLKGSPTGTPLSGRQVAHRPAAPVHHQTESAVLANMHSLYSTSPPGNATPALAQNQMMGFANHAQLLRARLSPLVNLADGGLSRAMDQPMESPNPVPATAIIENQAEKKPDLNKLPFMGHASTAPSSPTGMRAFFEIEDMWKPKPIGL